MIFKSSLLTVDLSGGLTVQHTLNTLYIKETHFFSIVYGPGAVLYTISSKLRCYINKNIIRCRAPENLKLAGNGSKIAAMCSLQDYQKSHIFIVFKVIITITVVFMHLFWVSSPIWLAFSISGSSFWLMDTYFWSCQNLKLAGNTFPLFPSFWSPDHNLQHYYLDYSAPTTITTATLTTAVTTSATTTTPQPPPP